MSMYLISWTHSASILVFNAKFPALTGILALAYFLHNCVISIMRNQKAPEKNVSPYSDWQRSEDRSQKGGLKVDAVVFKFYSLNC